MVNTWRRIDVSIFFCRSSAQLPGELKPVSLAGQMRFYRQITVFAKFCCCMNGDCYRLKQETINTGRQHRTASSWFAQNKPGCAAVFFAAVMDDKRADGLSRQQLAARVDVLNICLLRQGVGSVFQLFIVFSIRYILQLKYLRCAFGSRQHKF